MHSKSTTRERLGFTVIELLVSIAVIGILLALLIPAVQSAREASRRVDCSSRMKQVSLAVTNYHDLHLAFPSGVGFKYAILPHLGEEAIYHAKPPLAATPAVEAWRGINKAVIRPYICPSDSWMGQYTGASNIAGCFGSGVLNYGFNGFFNCPFCDWREWPSDWVRDADMMRGHSNIAMLSEMLVANGDVDAILRTNYKTPLTYAPGQLKDLVRFCVSIPEPPSRFGYSGVSNTRGREWFDGSFGHGLYNHAAGPNRPNCMNQTHLPTGVYPPTSEHPGGVNVAFGDGHVVFISDEIDTSVWRGMGGRIESVLAF